MRDTAVVYVDSAVAVEVTVPESEGSRRTQPPKNIYNATVHDVYHSVVIDVAKKGYAELSLGGACITVVISGDGYCYRNRAA